MSFLSFNIPSPQLKQKTDYASTYLALAVYGMVNDNKKEEKSDNLVTFTLTYLISVFIKYFPLPSVQLFNLINKFKQKDEEASYPQYEKEEIKIN